MIGMREFASFKRRLFRLKETLNDVVKPPRSTGYLYIGWPGTFQIAHKTVKTRLVPQYRSLLSIKCRVVATSQPIVFCKFNQPPTCITCINSEASCRSCACTVYQAAVEHETWTAVWAEEMTTKRSNSGSPRKKTRASC